MSEHFFENCQAERNYSSNDIAQIFRVSFFMGLGKGYIWGTKVFYEEKETVNKTLTDSIRLRSLVNKFCCTPSQVVPTVQVDLGMLDF